MKKNWQFWFIYFLAWTPYALGYATVFSVQSNTGFKRASVDSIHNILPAALFGVGVVWICRKFMPSGRQAVVFGISQFLLALMYAALWVGTVPLMFSLQWLLEGRGWFYSPFEGYALQWQFFAGLMIYATIASIVYTLEFSGRVREAQEMALRAEHLKTEAELNALRAQLNPHFLFNTLHSLMALVRYDSAAAENAIERLASLLRYSLKAKGEGENDDVSLAAEWSFVQNYLALERLRLGERLKIKSDFQSEALNCSLPAFTLQPLVENALKHAVSPNPEGVNVVITAKMENDKLRLEVFNDGAGTVKETVFSNGGTGLRLVRRRLETRYNGMSEFKVETAPGAGFRVSVTIPQEEMDLITGK